ncbi:probable transcriptional regulator SLK2 [Typha latifolia]|uniref:probable transcriptional regulator SLK2 n=1 Tax=Typha latifolia TaxID=4733 RepID=UPI003C2D6BDB
MAYDMIQQPQQILSPSAVEKHPPSGDLCLQRLGQFINHLQYQQRDNSMSSWRMFVETFFARQAKKRWCFSSYEKVGTHMHGVKENVSFKGAWRCNICGSESGKGFEAVFEALPRLYQIEFQSGIMDEPLSLGMLRQYRLLSGMTMIVDENTSQESVFNYHRVIHKGQLCIIFTPTLKIYSWEFCVRQHEKYVLYKMVETKADKLMQVFQMYKAAASGSGSTVASSGVSEAIYETFTEASCELARSLELPPLNVYGYADQFAQCLELADVASRMVELMDFSQKYNMGAIESLNTYHVQVAAAKLQTPKMHKVEQPRCLSVDPKDNLVALEFLNNDLSIADNFRQTKNMAFQIPMPTARNPDVKRSLPPHQQQLQLLQNCDLQAFQVHQQLQSIFNNNLEASEQLRKSHNMNGNVATCEVLNGRIINTGDCSSSISKEPLLNGEQRRCMNLPNSTFQ